MFRRLGFAGALAMALGGAAAAQTATPPQGGEAAKVEFVQQADGMTYADGTLTLKNPAELTLFFAERPNRFTGQMKNDEFARYWAPEGGTFAQEPPNAVVMVSNVENPPAVVELKSFAINGEGDFVYEVKVLEGTVPAYGEAVALFIDPVSYVGPHVTLTSGAAPPPSPPGAAPAASPPPPSATCHSSPNYPHRTCRVY
ncbi:MAG: hypothetical protein AcusKO_21480 [Acuticoccus sp.]